MALLQSVTYYVFNSSVILISINGNKKINGRRRNILVDTLGLPLVIFVCAANIQDGIAGIELLPLIDKSTKQLKLIRADKVYRSDFTEAAQ